VKNFDEHVTGWAQLFHSYSLEKRPIVARLNRSRLGEAATGLKHVIQAHGGALLGLLTLTFV